MHVATELASLGAGRSLAIHADPQVHRPAAEAPSGSVDAGPGRAAPGELAAEARRLGHEFNNLLTVIRGSLDPLRAAATDPLTIRRLDRIGAAVDGIAELIGDLVGTLRRVGEGGANGAGERRTLPQARAAETILLIEPDEIFRAQASAMLRGLGYRIEAAGDAEAGLDRLSGAERVDLMLVDRQVRCADGVALAERIKYSRREVRVLFSVTGATAQPGGTDAIAKPFQLLALATAVRAAIDGGPRP
jgi:CheY-like chemotaxis protein